MNHMRPRVTAEHNSSMQNLALQNFAAQLRKTLATESGEWKIVALTAQLKELEALIASR